MNTVAERIANAMEQQNISYGELARMTGIPKSAVYRYVTGQTEKMPLPRLELIAKALHVEPGYLMGWKEDSSPVMTEDEYDQELREVIEEMRNRPDMRMLFRLAKGAKAEDVRQAVKIIEALRAEDS